MICDVSAESDEPSIREKAEAIRNWRSFATEEGSNSVHQMAQVNPSPKAEEDP